MGRQDHRDASEPRTPDVDCRFNPPLCSDAEERGAHGARGAGKITFPLFVLNRASARPDEGTGK